MKFRILTLFSFILISVYAPLCIGEVMTENRIRLATSARYQSVNEPVDEDALTVHLGCAQWAEVYSEWETDDPLTYYQSFGQKVSHVFMLGMNARPIELDPSVMLKNI